MKDAQNTKGGADQGLYGQACCREAQELLFQIKGLLVALESVASGEETIYTANTAGALTRIGLDKLDELHEMLWPDIEAE